MSETLPERLSREAETIADRVARGAALLDEREPGWAGRIDADRLIMWDCHLCVLGRLYGSYVHGLNRLGLFEGIDTVSHGFYVSSSTLVCSTGEEYRDLAAAWRDEIANRVGKAEGVSP